MTDMSIAMPRAAQAMALPVVPACAPSVVPADGPVVRPLKSLHFTGLPDAAQAVALLDRIAASTCARAPRRVDRPLALYGAGNLGRMARAWCDRVGIPVALVVDAQANDMQDDPYWRGVPVRAPDAVSPQDRLGCLLAICVATAPNAPIEAQLHAQGWRDVVPFYDIAEACRDVHPLSNGWFAGALSASDFDGMAQVMSAWQDDVSRAHHLQFIAWRALRQEWRFDGAPVREGDRFFIEPVLAALGPHEHFLDVGAHQGEVLTRFIARVHGRFDSATAIEPDSASRSAMLRVLSALPETQRSKIGVLPVAVGEQAGRQRFAHGLGYASQLSAIGPEEIAVHSIDDLGLAPTFIKLHLEGHEGPAFRGARATLLRQRPIVAATIYHNRDGLFATAQWLMQHLPRYRFRLRLHSWCGTGAVIYGIPEERNA